MGNPFEGMDAGKFEEYGEYQRGLRDGMRGEPKPREQSDRYLAGYKFGCKIREQNRVIAEADPNQQQPGVKALFANLPRLWGKS